MLHSWEYPLEHALDEILVATKGKSGRDSVWQALWKDYGITRDNLITLEKMENALALVIGGEAKSLVRMAFERYLQVKREVVRKDETVLRDIERESLFGI
jgi:hypothetical protein